MQAVVYTEYGTPDVLRLVEVAVPEPKQGEVLVKIHAASVNPYDWRRLRASPFLVRMSEGLRRPKDPRLGADIAGQVEATGPGVTQFRPGDAVFGEISTGGFAEYVCVSEARLAPKPAHVAFEQAAAIPMVGLTALQGLRDFAHVQAGERVLINGASGGIGTIAVQYAKSVGAEVTGVCSTRNLDLVRGLGADHVIDYTREDFTRGGQRYDLIFDTVANRSVMAYRRALVPGGRCVVAGFSILGHMIVQLGLLGSLVGLIDGRKIASMGSSHPNAQDLRVLGELLATGKVVPPIDRRYPLAETADAIRYVETGRARGKVIITVVPEA